jgi:hypothetical protein
MVGISVKNKLRETPVAVMHYRTNVVWHGGRIMAKSKVKPNKRNTFLVHCDSMHSFENGVSEGNRRYEKNRTGSTGAGSGRYSLARQGMLLLTMLFYVYGCSKQPNYADLGTFYEVQRCRCYPCSPPLRHCQQSVFTSFS